MSDKSLKSLKDFVENQLTEKSLVDLSQADIFPWDYHFICTCASICILLGRQAESIFSVDYLVT